MSRFSAARPAVLVIAAFAIVRSATADPVNFNDYAVVPYGVDQGQDGGGTAAIEDNGATLFMTGNLWKCIAFAYTVTTNTLLAAVPQVAMI